MDFQQQVYHRHRQEILYVMFIISGNTEKVVPLSEIGF